MKNLLFLFAITIGFHFNYAQECKASLFMKEGTKLSYGDYSKKGKLGKTSVYETISLTQEDGGYVANIKAVVKDKKGKEEFTTNYNAACKDGVFSIDMIRFFDMSKLSEHKDMKLVIDGEVLKFPVGMKEGDKLQDGEITIKVNSTNDFTLVTMTFRVFNREVVGHETITTPAGTFDCQKVTFDFDSKFGILRFKGSGVEWYKEDKAVIRSESYNKKGKLLGYSELISIAE